MKPGGSIHSSLWSDNASVSWWQTPRTMSRTRNHSPFTVMKRCCPQVSRAYTDNARAFGSFSSDKAPSGHTMSRLVHSTFSKPLWCSNRARSSAINPSTNTCGRGFRGAVSCNVITLLPLYKPAWCRPYQVRYQLLLPPVNELVV